MANNETGFERENIYDSIDLERDGILKSNEQILQNENSDLKKDARNSLLLAWFLGFVAVLVLAAAIPIGLAATSGGGTIIAICAAVSAGLGVLTIFAGKDFVDKQKIVDKTIVKQTETQQKLQQKINQTAIKKLKETTKASQEANVSEARTIVDDAETIKKINKMQNEVKENTQKEQVVVSEGSLAKTVSNVSVELQENASANTSRTEEAALKIIKQRSEAIKTVNETVRVNNSGMEERERIAITLSIANLKQLDLNIFNATTYSDCDTYLKSLVDKDKAVEIFEAWRSITSSESEDFDMGRKFEDKDKGIINNLVRAKLATLEAKLQQDKEQHAKLGEPFNNTQNIANGVGPGLKPNY